MRRLAAVLALAVTIASPAAVRAWTPTGTQISKDPLHGEYAPLSAADGAGGAFVVSPDQYPDLARAQHVDAGGTPTWGPSGVAVPAIPAGASLQGSNPVADGTGGVYVIYWVSVPITEQHIYIYRITAAGTPAWGSSTDVLGAGHQGQVQGGVSDGSGGIFVFWSETDGFVRGQHVNAAGATLWAAGGAVLGGAGEPYGTSIRAVSDGTGGSVLFWSEVRTVGVDLFAQRVNASGVPQWSPSTGVSVCTAGGDQYVSDAAADGTGGFVTVWADYRFGNADVYAQKLNASGVLQWTAGGVPISTAAGDKLQDQVVADGIGGTVIAWDDFSLGAANQRIRVQHMNAAGSPTWAAGGVQAIVSPTQQADMDLAGDGAGGAIVAWDDGAHVLAQHLGGSSGLRLLGDPGWRVAPSVASELSPTLAPDGAGGAVVAWSDGRDGALPDLYAQRLYAAGRPGVTATASLVSAPASSPALVPLEHTARLDVVFAEANGQIEAYRPDGSLVTGFPIATGYVPSGGPVAVGDCEGDGHFELFAGTASGKVVGYRDDGTGLPGWPVSLGTGQPAFVAIGPLGADGSPRIVALSGNRIDAFHADGTSLGGLFPVTLPGLPSPTITVPPAIGDLTGDGVREIVAAAGGTLYVYNASGLFEFSFSLPAGETISDAPTLADVDLDGQLEIAVPTSGGRLFLLNANGSLRPGYPIAETPNIPLTSVAFANVAGTPEIELAYAEEKEHAHLRLQDGEQLLTWPESSSAAADFDAAPVIGSTNGGTGDVVIGGDDGLGYAWTNIAGSVTGWPYDIGDRCVVSPAVGDLDQDGMTDVVFLTRSQMVIMTTFGSFAGLLPLDPHSRWPMAGYDPERTGCLACSGLPAALGVGPQAQASAMLLAPPSPNPVRGATTLRFELPQAGRARIAVFDAAGREVARPVDDELAAGPHAVSWDANGQPPGVYLVRLETMAGAMTRRVAVIR